jgi:protein-S-isoprenylcysteine O-methyltransferase Ste14
MTATDAATRLTVVRIGITLLNLVVGFLFLVRMPLVREAGIREALLCIPALVVCGVAFKLSPPPNTWPIFAQAVFAVGIALTIVSFLFLGRSFAVLPAVRKVVSRGPYRFVRHPAYAGEFLLVLAFFLSGPRWLAVWPLVAVVPFIVIRILMEESLLNREPAYRAYAQAVRWRLVPGVW